MSETGYAEPGPLTDKQLDWMAHDVGGTSLMYAAQYEIRKLRSALALPADPAPASEVESAVMESLAAIEHERWSGWILHQLKVGITPERINRWVKLANTPYAELTEELKESDRVEVRKTLAALTGKEGAK